MYTIYIENLKVRAIIGILEKEREASQLIVANCFLEYEKQDDEFINYAEVASLIEESLVKQKYMLIEDALDEIVDAIHKMYREVKSVKLKLSKPDILKNCIVGVELFRKF